MACGAILPVVDHVRFYADDSLIFRHKKVFGHLARAAEVEPLRPENFFLILQKFVPTALDVEVLQDQAHPHAEKEACRAAIRQRDFQRLIL